MRDAPMRAGEKWSGSWKGEGRGSWEGWVFFKKEGKNNKCFYGGGNDPM